MTNDDLQTLRIDAGEPYLWQVGDVAVMVDLRASDKSDDLRVTLKLSIDSDEARHHKPVRRGAVLTLDPWRIQWDAAVAGDPLPQPLTHDHLSALLTKHRDDLVWRAGKLLQARDRDQWRRADLSGYQPRALVNYRTLFPADFDIVHSAGGKPYWLEDYHCLEPGCSCGTVAFSITELNDDGGREIGNATVDLFAPRLSPTGDKAAIAVARKVLQEPAIQKRVAKRHAECRRIASALAAHMGRAQTTVVNQAKVGRNDPCPCGSGKKYKKCCLNRSG